MKCFEIKSYLFSEFLVSNPYWLNNGQDWKIRAKASQDQGYG